MYMQSVNYAVYYSYPLKGTYSLKGTYHFVLQMQKLDIKIFISCIKLLIFSNMCICNDKKKYAFIS